MPAASCCLLCEPLPQTQLGSTVSSSASSERETLGFYPIIPEITPDVKIQEPAFRGCSVG